MNLLPKESAALARLPEREQAYWESKIRQASGFEKKRQIEKMTIIAGVADYLEGRSNAVVRNLIQERLLMLRAAQAAFFPPAPDWFEAQRKPGNIEWIFESQKIVTGNKSITGYGD